MAETPTKRGRPRGVESQHVMVRMPVDLIAQIDAYAASLQERIGISDMNISRGMAIRELVKRGLQGVQAGPSSPPSHLATVEEPEPMAAPQAPETPSPTLAPRETPSAPVGERTNETLLHRTQRALPREKLQEIAETAAEYDKLNGPQLSQLLFDRGIYRSVDRETGEEKPVNRGTLKVWLDQARAAGLL